MKNILDLVDELIDQSIVFGGKDGKLKDYEILSMSRSLLVKEIEKLWVKAHPPVVFVGFPNGDIKIIQISRYQSIAEGIDL